MEKVAPFFYIVVEDGNANVTRVIVGPTTFTKQDHEKILTPPTQMLIVPPRHYCIIKNPAVRDPRTREPILDKFGQVCLRHGDREIRFAEDWPDPFPLMPDEALEGEITLLPLVIADAALRLHARRNFADEDGVDRVAGDVWLFKGPATYRPRVEVEVLETIVATTILPDQGLRLRATCQLTDSDGNERKAGEEWLVRTAGMYLPQAEEEVLGIVQPKLLTQTRALHLRATDAFQDTYGAPRKAGEEWLVTSAQAVLHLPDVHEAVESVVDITVLNNRQYCVILDPVGRDCRNQYGSRELRVGPAKFFLFPGERVELTGARGERRDGIKEIYVLGGEEALLLRAREGFNDGGEPRTPGDLWMIAGPCDFVPRVEVEVVETRVRIPLDEGEGIYVRNIKTGKVRSVTGQTYMLTASEVLWEKELTPEVESLLDWSHYSGDGKVRARKVQRDKTRIVTFRVPHNCAVQIYDYKAKRARVVFGPGLVMLEPDEQFTVNSLSGGKPKRPDQIKSLALCLGPDFMTDIIEVETMDHARLRLQLSYNWHFAIDYDRHAESKERDEQAQLLFNVRDFVGDACKAIASRVRSSVAGVAFDDFHRSSARLIRVAVFGQDPRTGKIRDEFIFVENKLTITNIDIQNVEPVDERTRESLMKSVQLAIEITTRKQERNARHAAQQIEQEAQGKIARQRISNQATAEEARQQLIQLQAECAALASTGTAKAEAEAKAEYLEIEAGADVEKARLQAEASEIEARAELKEVEAEQKAEVEHQAELSALALRKQSRIAEIEAEKFKQLVTAIQPSTIRAIAQAGPEMQARLLKALGLKGYLLTDGNSPVNLFNAAKGMVGDVGNQLPMAAM